MTERIEMGTYTFERETEDATTEITVWFTVSGSYRPQRACPVNGMEPAEFPEVEIEEARDERGQLVELTQDEIDDVESHAVNNDDEDDDRGDYLHDLMRDRRMEMED